jgi:hypothetical protein
MLFMTSMALHEALLNTWIDRIRYNFLKIENSVDHNLFLYSIVK